PSNHQGLSRGRSVCPIQHDRPRQCGREDSNLHGRSHRLLRPARLPIPPHPRAFFQQYRILRGFTVKTAPRTADESSWTRDREASTIESPTHASELSPDRPLSDPAADALGHALFAAHLAGVIATMAPSDGLAVALYGDPGAGRTTALN